jgi:hypothetical protein
VLLQDLNVPIILGVSEEVEVEKMGNKEYPHSAGALFGLTQWHRSSATIGQGPAHIEFLAPTAVWSRIFGISTHTTAAGGMNSGIGTLIHGRSE